MHQFARRVLALVLALHAAATVAAAAPPRDPPSKCAADAVLVGAGCVDRYEASAWRIPDPTGANKALAKKVRQGKATVANLTAGGATQLGTGGDDYAPCLDDGAGCQDVFAASLPGLTPARHLTWFQAQIACANSGRRLLRNADWQMAVTGTPDPGTDDGTTDCNVASTAAAATTGSRSACVSAFGAHDMVGNLAEWVAEWMPRSTTCGAWAGSADDQCLAGAETSGEPGALLRGGSFLEGVLAGPLAIRGGNGPSTAGAGIGFRCAR